MMNRKDKNKIYNDLKNNFSKSMYSCRKKILLSFDSIDDFWNKHYLLCDVDRHLENEKNKKAFFETYKNNPQLAENLIYANFDFNSLNLKYLLDTYTENLLTNNTYIILCIEGIVEDYFYKKIDKNFISFAKKYPIEFQKLINNYNFFEIILKKMNEKNVDFEIILKNIDKIEMLKNISEFLNLDKIQYERLLNLDIERVSLLLSTYNKIKTANKIPGGDGYCRWVEIKNYLLNNPDLDNIMFLNNIFLDEIPNASLDVYFRETTDSQQIMNLINFYFASEENVNQLKEKIKVLFFKLHGVDQINHRVEELLLNNSNEYPEEVKMYLNFYRQLKECNNSNDLKQLLEQMKNFKILSYDEICEFLIVNYNRNLNKSLLNPDKLSSENIYVRYEPFEQEINGSKVIKNIKIITIKNISFQSLTTSIDYKIRKACLSDEQYNFNSKLVDNPNLWLSKPKHGTNYISMSANTDKYFKTFGHESQIIAGFCNIGDNQIKASFSGDRGTNMKEGTTISSIISELKSIDEITGYSKKSYFGYNRYFSSENAYTEVISERSGIVPDYFFGATKVNNSKIPISTEKRTMNWAAYYDKPIIEIDCESYYKYSMEKFYKKLKDIQNNVMVPTMQDLKELEILKVEAETFYFGYFIDYYDLIMTAIDMTNRKWTVENINRLKIIIDNTFDSEHSDIMYKVEDNSFLKEQKDFKKEQRRESVNRLKNIINTKFVEINDITEKENQEDINETKKL